MVFDLKDRIEAEKAKTRFEYLLSKEKTIEILDKRKTRSVSQNAYLHLLLSAFGLNFGYTLQEVKQYIFKEIVNPDIFNDGEKHGIVSLQSWRSSADLNTKEMSDSVDRFLKYSAEHGYRLPEPDDLVWINQIKNEVETNKKYL